MSTLVEGIPDELLKNGDLFDFYEAIDNYGFGFEEFAENNFKSFIEVTFITDFISLRKAYLIRDFIQLRLVAHKLKGLFGLFSSKKIHENCEKIQMIIQKGEILVDDLYCSVVKNMLEFFNEFINFAQKINKPIYAELISKFWEYNNLCNELEDFGIRSTFTKDEIDLSDMTIDGKNSQKSVCCAGGDACRVI